MKDATVRVKVGVTHVGEGGNANNGEYLYSFSPDVILVERQHTTLHFELDGETSRNFEIRDLVSTDSRFQFSEPLISEDARSVSVVDANTQRELISLAILVFDTQREKHVVCDPQVVNSPIRN